MSLKNFNARPGRKVDKRTMDIIHDKDQLARFTLRMPSNLYASLKKKAIDEKMDVTFILNMLVRYYLDGKLKT